MTIDQFITIVALVSCFGALACEVGIGVRLPGRLLFTVGRELGAGFILLVVGSAHVASRLQDLLASPEPTAWAVAAVLAHAGVFTFLASLGLRKFAIYENGVGSGPYNAPWENIESHSWVRDRKNPEWGPARLRLHYRPETWRWYRVKKTTGPKVHGKEMRDAIDAPRNTSAVPRRHRRAPQAKKWRKVNPRTT